MTYAGKYLLRKRYKPIFSTQYHIKPEYESKKGVIMVTRLEVTYKSQGIDEELDRQIEKFFKSIGFYRWAAGYDLMSSERDLAFEKRGEGEHTIKEIEPHPCFVTCPNCKLQYKVEQKHINDGICPKCGHLLREKVEQYASKRSKEAQLTT